MWATYTAVHAPTRLCLMTRVVPAARVRTRVVQDTLDALCHVCDLTAALLDPRRSGKSAHDRTTTLVRTVTRRLAALWRRACRPVGQWWWGWRGQQGPSASAGTGQAGAASGRSEEPGALMRVGGAGAWPAVSEAAAGCRRAPAVGASRGEREGRQAGAGGGGSVDTLAALAAAIHELDLRRLKVSRKPLCAVMHCTVTVLLTLLRARLTCRG